MDLDQLDRMFQKRWILLIHSYFPFFKTPSPFHLKCRNFINDLKKTATNSHFPLQQLPELLLILEVYSRNKPELIHFSKKIIGTLNETQYQQIDSPLLMQVLSEFPSNLHTPIVNEFLEKIPTPVYQRFIADIATSDHKKHFLKWVKRLDHRFSLMDKFGLVLSLADNFVSQHIMLINFVAIGTLQNLEESVLSARSYLHGSHQEKFLYFILKWKSSFKLSHEFLVSLLNPWLREKNTIVLAYLNTLEEENRFNFLYEIIQKKELTSAKILLDHCPTTHYSALVDRLLNLIFESFKPDKNSDVIFLTEKPSPDDYRFMLLLHLAINHAPQLKFWQFLTVNILRAPAITTTMLIQLQEKGLSQLVLEKNFSSELKEYIVENSIKAIKIFIRDTLFNPIKNENTRQNLEKRFTRFFTNPHLSVDDFKELTATLPTPIQQQYQTDFFIIQQLLHYFSVFLAQQSIKEAKKYRIIADEKTRTDFASKMAARQALTADLMTRQLSRIPHQTMEKLFGEQAESVKEKWQSKFGIQFFHAENEENYKTSLPETTPTKELHHGRSARFF